ncbi:MAG TPA: hypothetical protein VG435_01710 [Acidimicrobiales bacterium]|jgi:acyl dehydratase|nr:hypothetical protein [Acidimicrobiales bacterium]
MSDPGPAPAVFDSLDDLLAAPPRPLGTTPWVLVGADELADFERATGALSGFMALSVTNRFLPDLIQVPAASSGVNYGADSVRFGAPLSVGDRIRVGAVLVDATPVRGGVQTTVEITVSVDGAEHPACVVRSLSRWLA